MKDKQNPVMIAALCFITLFFVWTALVAAYDVQPIGPDGTTVGFAGLNSAFHELTGVHMSLYHFTDIAELFSFGFVIGFAALGIYQLIKRKSLSKVDHSILLLGGLYVVVLAIFVIFNKIPINYRPILIDGAIEPSYPSSTTLLVLCIIPSAIIQFNKRIKNRPLRRVIACVLIAYMLMIVVCRTISGVHWITDIIGSIILSAGLVMLYSALSTIFHRKR